MKLYGYVLGEISRLSYKLLDSDLVCAFSSLAIVLTIAEVNGDYFS